MPAPILHATLDTISSKEWAFLNKQQKWTADPYLRQFDTFHRPILAICPDLPVESMGFLPSLKIGEFLSQSVFRAKLFVRKISIGSSI